MSIIQKEVFKQAVILYCSSEEKEFIVAQLDYAIYVDNLMDLTTLRQLDESSGGRYRLLVADSPEIALRGLDYRAYENGILLLTT